MEFTLEVPDRPKDKPRLCLYGPSGVGKTTFGRNSDKPVLIMTEDGCPHGIPKLPSQGKIEEWPDLLGAGNYLIKEDHDRETVVIDTINGAEEICRNYICQKEFGGRWLPEKGKEGFMQWAQGDKRTGQEFTRLLNGLEILRTQKGMRVILLAHEGLHRCSNAFGDDFLKSGADMSKYSWPLVMKWCDHIGHATKDVMAAVKKGERVAKPKGDNQRWIYFEGSPARDAKSRAGYEMPDKIGLSFDDYIKQGA